MTRANLVNGFYTAERDGLANLGEGLFLQTFELIKQEDWFGTEMDNLNWDGCEDEDIFLLSDTGDAIKIASIEELLDEVEHDDDPVQVYRVWAETEYDCFNEQTFETLEEAVAEAERLWICESYKTICVSSEEWLTEDGYPNDHNVIWLDGKTVEEE